MEWNAFSRAAFACVCCGDERISCVLTDPPSYFFRMPLLLRPLPSSFLEKATHGAVPDWDSNFPGGKSCRAACRHRQDGAQRLSLLAPSQWTPQIRVEPHFDAIAAAGTSVVLYPLLLPVHCAGDSESHFLAATLELDYCPRG